MIHRDVSKRVLIRTKGFFDWYSGSLAITLLPDIRNVKQTGVDLIYSSKTNLT